MGRPNIQYRSTSAQVLKDFRVAHPKVSISYDQFSSIIRTCNEMIVEHVLETGEKFKLPHGFGHISIHKWKPKRWRVRPSDGKQFNNLSIDWKKSKELGKHVYHLNHHSGGYRVRWKWFSEKAIFRHKDVFMFKPNRVASRKLAQYMKLPNSPYSQIYRTWDRVNTNLNK